MKRGFLLTGLLTICANLTIAQRVKQPAQCDFQTNLTFKNGADTITVLAYTTALVRTGPMLPSLAKLVKLKKVKFKIRSSVAFKLINCPNEIVADCIDQHSFSYAMVPGDEKKLVQMRCIFFEGFSEFSKPYFVIDSIKPYNGN